MSATSGAPRVWTLRCENYCWQARTVGEHDYPKFADSVTVVETTPIMELLERLLADSEPTTYYRLSDAERAVRVRVEADELVAFLRSRTGDAS